MFICDCVVLFVRVLASISLSLDDIDLSVICDCDIPGDIQQVLFYGQISLLSFQYLGQSNKNK